MYKNRSLEGSNGLCEYAKQVKKANEQTIAFRVAATCTDRHCELLC